jgi:hypothetical protein
VWYKTVARLLILTVFNLVLTTPVAAREVREATANAVDGGEVVKIVSGKRPLDRLWIRGMGSRPARAGFTHASWTLLCFTSTVEY